MIRTDHLTPMQRGRLQIQLDKQWRFDGKVMTMGAWLEGQSSIERSEGDGMIRYNRLKFNRMDHLQQCDYMAKLRAERHFYINGFEVPRVVYDAVA